jgi:predicted NBD/HSP70 family sugar kinase
MSEMPEAAIGAVNGHGLPTLPSVCVDAYNAECRKGDTFIGDHASKRAFGKILDEWRERVGTYGGDPFGDIPSEQIPKKQLDTVLQSDDLEAAGLIHAAIEGFAVDLAHVTKRFLGLKAWRDTEQIVIGGGFRKSRVAELIIGRAIVELKAGGHDVRLVPIRHHPDEAGLLGAVHLVPVWALTGYDGILAVDIGGSNIRAGVVELRLDKDPKLAEARVCEAELWRHADDNPSRDDAVDYLIDMLHGRIEVASKEKLRLAPFIGIGCPGVIRSDGTIARGGQNLPGNWETRRFKLPDLIRHAIPRIGEHEITITMHNDAVVQGLSEVPFMQDVRHWGTLTIGTGLGNARFSNRVN